MVSGLLTNAHTQTLSCQMIIPFTNVVFSLISTPSHLRTKRGIYTMANSFLSQVFGLVWRAAHGPGHGMVPTITDLPPLGHAWWIYRPAVIRFETIGRYRITVYQRQTQKQVYDKLLSIKLYTLYMKPVNNAARPTCYRLMLENEL